MRMRGATSVTPSGEPSNSARRARSSRAPAKRRCSARTRSAAGSGGDLTRDEILDPDVTEEVRQHELATSHYMATPEHFLWHARQSEDKGSVADFLSAVIVDEKSVWDYNRGITSRDGVNRIASDPPVEKLVPIYPTDGFYVADNPAVVLNGAWIDELETAAGQDFLRFAVTKQGQKIVRETGYRDLNGEFDPLVAEVGQFAADPTGALPFPRGSVIRATQTRSPRCASAPRCSSSSTSRARWRSRSRAARPSSPPRKTRSPRRSATSRRATTWASPPSRPTTTVSSRPDSSALWPTSATNAPTS